MKAFPIYFKHPTTGAIIEHQGMELRDYFAAHAMSSMIELMFKAKPSDEVIDSAMASCYRIADAMIKAREKTNE